VHGRRRQGAGPAPGRLDRPVHGTGHRQRLRAPGREGRSGGVGGELAHHPGAVGGELRQAAGGEESVHQAAGRREDAAGAGEAPGPRQAGAAQEERRRHGGGGHDAAGEV